MSVLSASLSGRLSVIVERKVADETDWLYSYIDTVRYC